jgi:putative transposase
VQRACTLTGISRATYYRQAKPVGPLHGPWLPRTPPPHTLSPAEREQVLAVLNAPGYTDLAIPQVWARELDQGRYWCSMSTMYRIARAAGQSRERRRQATHPPRVRPELVATGPSQVWSWDITALKGPVKGVWFKCYVIIDIFSRYVTGWLVRRAMADPAVGAARLFPRALWSTRDSSYRFPSSWCVLCDPSRLEPRT